MESRDMTCLGKRSPSCFISMSDTPKEEKKTFLLAAPQFIHDLKLPFRHPPPPHSRKNEIILDIFE